MRSVTEGLFAPIAFRSIEQSSPRDCPAAIAALTAKRWRRKPLVCFCGESSAGSALHPQGTSSLDPLSRLLCAKERGILSSGSPENIRAPADKRIIPLRDRAKTPRAPAAKYWAYAEKCAVRPKNRERASRGRRRNRNGCPFAAICPKGCPPPLPIPRICRRRQSSTKSFSADLPPGTKTDRPSPYSVCPDVRPGGAPPDCRPRGREGRARPRGSVPPKGAARRSPRSRPAAIHGKTRDRACRPPPRGCRPGIPSRRASRGRP